MTQYQEPSESWQWITPEIRDLLQAIPDPHRAKKRATVIRLAFARANHTPLSEVFNREDTCAENIWWTKWQHIPEIKAAHDACVERALTWADNTTAQLEEKYRRERRQAVAEYASKAPAALAAVMEAPDGKGADRINAAVTLINLADGTTVGPVASSSDVKVGDQAGGLTVKVVYDDANSPPTQTVRGASADTG